MNSPGIFVFIICILITMSVERIDSTQYEKGPVLDHCGVVAAYSSKEFTFYPRGVSGLHRINTRGQSGAGVMSFHDDGSISKFQNKGMVEDAFTPEITQEWKGKRSRSWAFQTRYGTHGNNGKHNLQPIVRALRSSGEQFSIIHNGNFVKKNREGDISDTVQFAEELANIDIEDWDEKILQIQNSNTGAWSLVVNTKDAMYAMRDPYGIRPLSYGIYQDPETEKNVYVVASETSALEAMGISEFTEVMPGTVLRFDNDGVTLLQHATNVRRQAQCAFENAYTKDPYSKLHARREHPKDINIATTVADFREKTGRLLALKEDPEIVKRADVVIGVPGTGIVGAKTYASALGLPYVQAIVDDNNGERTFIMENIDEIAQKVANHFEFKPTFLRGMKIIIVDDSVVRGNIIEGLIKLLKEVYGADEVHIRALFPPVDKPCYLGVATKEIEELLAGRHNSDIEKMREEAGADSLVYVTAEDIIEATGNDQICLGCTVGHFPPVSPVTIYEANAVGK